MPAAAGARAIDETLVRAVLRRMARNPQPPWLHAEVARRMAERLPVVRLEPSTLLDWWGHTGASADLLRAAYPKARRVVFEPDDALLARSREAAQRPWWTARRGAAAEVRGDEPQAGTAQLLWANMMLHAIADLPALLERWQRALAVDGFLMFSTLGPDTLRELHALYRRLGWPAPGADFVDMHDLGDMLIDAGFADPVMDQERLTLTWDSPQALLAELRQLGANASAARFAGLRTPRWRARLHEALAALAAADGRIAMSFEVVYGHAFKAAPRVRSDAPTKVSVQDMRAMLKSARQGHR
ncbi:MAG: biotin synthase [Burkholderiaceae bacterium]|nr:biotin synthase [Burkholderiaceae bacterium]